MSYDLCGHCDQVLSEKALKEHRRLYFHNGAWIRLTETQVTSRTSSPISISSPSMTSDTQQHHSDHSISSSESDMPAFTEFEYEDPMNQDEPTTVTSKFTLY